MTRSRAVRLWVSFLAVVAAAVVLFVLAPLAHCDDAAYVGVDASSNLGERIGALGDIEHRSVDTLAHLEYSSSDKTEHEAGWRLSAGYLRSPWLRWYLGGRLAIRDGGPWRKYVLLARAEYHPRPWARAYVETQVKAWDQGTRNRISAAGSELSLPLGRHVSIAWRPEIVRYHRTTGEGAFGVAAAGLMRISR